MQNKIELKPNDKVLFIGDSITDADRNHPAHKPFGFGYIHFIAKFLLGKYPTYNLNILNTGISGNTIRDLKDRWQRDVVAELRGEASKHSADPHVVFPKHSEGKVMGADHNPNILSILIGVNDVWRQFATEDELPYAVQLDEYETTYRQLLTMVTQKCNSRLVICEPFMFCDDFDNPMFVHLRTFIEVVHRIADDFDACIVPLQKAIDGRIKDVPPQSWSQDSVHPEIWAHAWIAQQWLLATGL